MWEGRDTWLPGKSEADTALHSMQSQRVSDLLAQLNASNRFGCPRISSLSMRLFLKLQLGLIFQPVRSTIQIDQAPGLIDW